MDEQPPWLDEPCPPWCATEHRVDDHPEDRRHLSEGRHVVALMTSAPATAEGPSPVEVVVQLDQPVGGPVTWVRLAPAEALPPGAGRLPRLRIDSDGARELADELLGLLALT